MSGSDGVFRNRLSSENVKSVMLDIAVVDRNGVFCIDIWVLVTVLLVFAENRGVKTCIFCLWKPHPV